MTVGGELLEELELLAALPPSEDVYADLQACLAAVEALALVGREPPPHLLGDQEHFTRLLERAHERDRRLEERRALGEAYASCWCLGAGGRRRVGLAIRTSAHGVVSDGRTGYAEICPCPDGAEAARQQAEVLDELALLAEERLTVKLLGEAQVPQRYAGASLDAWREAQLEAGREEATVQLPLSLIELWWRNVEENDRHAGALPCLLLMLGDYGVGKTTCAVAILRDWLALGRHGLLWTAQELLDELRAGFGEPHGHRTLLAVKRVPLLILDDLGAEALTERQAAWAVPLVLEVLSYRQARCLPTVITTNLRPAELHKRLGGRAAERALSTETALIASFHGLANLRGARW